MRDTYTYDGFHSMQLQVFAKVIARQARTGDSLSKLENSYKVLISEALQSSHNGLVLFASYDVAVIVGHGVIDLRSHFCDPRFPTKGEEVLFELSYGISYSSVTDCIKKED